MNFLYEPLCALYTNTCTLVSLCVWGVQNRHLLKSVAISYTLKYLRDNTSDTFATIDRRENNQYVITYTLNNERSYNIPLTKSTRRPRNRLMMAWTSDGEDVTDTLEQWYGPYYDFHAQPVTPEMMGFDTLHVQTLDNEELTFDSKKIITI